MSKGQTDRQTKSSRWQFTAYQDQWALFEAMPPGIAEWGWQREICPETNREHYQGFLRLAQQQRFAWLAKLLPGVHLEVARNWQALIAYCKKEDTRVSGTQPVHHTNSIPTHFQYAEQVAIKIARSIPHGRSINELSNERLQQLIDDIVKQDISDGKRYAAWIASNPQWKAMWKPYGRVFIISFISINATQLPPAPEEERSAQGEDVSRDV